MKAIRVPSGDHRIVILCVFDKIDWPGGIATSVRDVTHPTSVAVDEEDRSESGSAAIIDCQSEGDPPSVG